MNEDDKARPVSGEIMTGTPATRTHVEREGFADADFETVTPRFPPRRKTPAQPASPEGMDFLKRASKPQRSSGQPGGALFWTTGVALVFLAFWISGGHAFVRHMVLPQQGQAQPALRIADVRSKVEHHNGRDVLFVDGSAENHDGKPQILPGIEIVVFANDGAATRYLLATNETELEPGGRYAFSSRLEAPANGVKTVAVTFQEGSR